MLRIRAWLSAIVFAGLLSAPSMAQSPEAFYAGKSVTMIIGSGVGGGYDSYGRLVAQHIGRHIPGSPTVVVQNMPGAGSLNMTNYVYNVAPKDGTVLGAGQNGVAFEPLFHLLSPDGKNARYDGNAINWIGSPAREDFVPFVRSDTKVAVFRDLRTTKVLFGANEMNTDNGLLAILLNRMFNTKIEVVPGYPGSTQSLFLAMERHEIDGMAGMSFASLKAVAPHLLTDKKIRILAQIGLEKNPELASDIPLLLDLAANEDDKEALRALFTKYEMARPLFAAPGVPAERVAALRKAFIETVQDPEFLQDAQKQRLEIELVPGEKIQDLVAQVYKTPKPLIERIRNAISLNN